jgi:SAM-dependent methyltransferase
MRNPYNFCSGQRRFGDGWTNIDKQERDKPDLIADCRSLPMIESESSDMVVIHHGLEHSHLGEGDAMIQEAHRILAPGGSLIVCVPDLRALAKAWLRGEINDYIYCVNIYGAFQGDSDSDHHWGWSQAGLYEYLGKMAQWRGINPFGFRHIEGADIAQAWWVLALECIK